MDLSRWNERTASTRYRYVRVSRATGGEMEVLTMLKGGAITRNNDVRVMETAECNRTGALDIGADLVRVYMTATWPDGESADVCLGTFLPSVPGRSVKAGYSTATVSMRGRLQELLDDGYGTPVVLPKGTNAVQAAADVCRQSGLEVVADPSDFTITNPRTYGIGQRQNNSEVGDTKLDMVNDLLSLAGFRAAKTDPYGRVLLRKYSNLADTAPSWEFREGATAKFEREMTEERDTSDVANHVVVAYATDERTVVGEAYDDDPNSEFSTVTVGRTITKGYEFNELPSDGQAAADRKARQLLAQNQSVIKKVTMRHAYAPVTVNDAVTLAYASGGITGKFEVRTQTMSLTAGCPTQAELRSWER